MLSVATYATLAEAASAMTPTSRFLAGGTLVMRDVNFGDQDFDRIVRAPDPALKAITPDSGRISIGAGVTMAGILASRDLDFLWPAARAVGGPAIRSMATVGGNLFAPHPYGDLAAALLALDGIVHLADGNQVPLDQFLANREGLVRSVSVIRPAGDAFRFHKVSRVKPKGASVLTIAAWLNRSAGRLSNVRIAYGAFAATPVRVTAVERALEGVSLDPAGIAPALQAATDGLAPVDDALASGWYRAEIAPVYLRRVLLGEVR